MKLIIFVIIVICSLILFTGCTELIRTEYRDIEVSIVDKCHTPSYPIVEYNVALKLPITKIIPEVYEIIVEYNGVEYTIYGSETYDKYKNMVGQKTMAILEICTYDDGSIEYNITELK